GRQGGPIADLLSSSAEEEIELLSISADEELAGGRPTEPPRVAAEDEDLDRAFGNIAPPATVPAPKVAAKKVPLVDDLPQGHLAAVQGLRPLRAPGHRGEVPHAPGRSRREGDRRGEERGWLVRGPARQGAGLRERYRSGAAEGRRHLRRDVAAYPGAGKRDH